MHPMQLKVECKEMDNHALQLVEVEICNCDKRQTRSVTEPTLKLCATPKVFWSQMTNIGVSLSPEANAYIYS